MATEEEIYKFNSKNDASHLDYIRLRSGYDELSLLSGTELGEYLPGKVKTELILEFNDDISSLEKAARWIIRGLRIDKAIAKVRCDNLEYGPSKNRTRSKIKYKFQLGQEVNFQGKNCIVLGCYSNKNNIYALSSEKGDLKFKNSGVKYRLRKASPEMNCILVDEIFINELEITAPTPVVQYTTLEISAEVNPKAIVQVNERSQLSGDVIDASYRVAATQLTKLFTKLIIVAAKTLTKKQAKTFNKFLHSSAGSGFISYAIGYILTCMPQFTNNIKAQRLAKEFRIHGIAEIGEDILNIFIDGILPKLSEAINDVPQVEILDYGLVNQFRMQ